MRAARRLGILLATLAATCAAVRVSVAQTYDAVLDYSTTNNPNGVWSYGWSTGLPGFTLFDATRTIGFLGPPDAQEWYPFFLGNTYRTDIVFWEGAILLGTDTRSDFSIARWTAPSANTYTVRGSFAPFYPQFFNGQQFFDAPVSILHNGTPVFSAATSPGGPAIPFPATGSPPMSLSLRAGDVLDFVSGWGNRSNLQATISGPVAPPRISNAAVVSETATGVTVNWNTDVPATSEVDFGTSTGYGRSASSSALVTAHTVVLSGLLPSTLYHFRVDSASASGSTAHSADGTFVTSSAVSGPSGPFTFTITRQSDGSYLLHCEYQLAAGPFQASLYNVRLVSASLGAASAPGVPALPRGLTPQLTPGQAVSFDLTFPSSAGRPGSVVGLIVGINSTIDPIYDASGTTVPYGFRVQLP